MKNFVFILITAALITALIWSLKRPAQIKYAPQGKSDIGKTDPPKVWDDDTGASHSTYKETKNNVVTKKDLNNPDKPLSIIDSAAILLKLARTEILSIKRINSITQDSLLIAKAERDHLRNRLVYVYNDKYVNLKFSPPIDTTDSGTFDFAYNNEVTVTEYFKRDKVLGLAIGAKRNYIDISSNDPRTKINGLKALRVATTPSYWMRLQASLNYNPSSGSIGFGPAIRVDLNRFSLQLNNSWYPDKKKWDQDLKLNYDILRF